jgi:hypothetical protein
MDFASTESRGQDDDEKDLDDNIASICEYMSSDFSFVSDRYEYALLFFETHDEARDALKKLTTDLGKLVSALQSDDEVDVAALLEVPFRADWAASDVNDLYISLQKTDSELDELSDQSFSYELSEDLHDGLLEMGYKVHMLYDELNDDSRSHYGFNDWDISYGCGDEDYDAGMRAYWDD